MFDYLEGGAEAELAMAHNRRCIEEFRLMPKQLRNISSRDLTVKLFGQNLVAPLIIAPTGLNGVLYPQGDIVLAEAAAKAGIPFVVATPSNVSLEDIANNAGGNLWFQLYVINRTLSRSLMDRALRVGYKTLVLTVDTPVSGKRARDLRNKFTWPLRPGLKSLGDGLFHPRWALGFLRTMPHNLANLCSDPSAQAADHAALAKREMDLTFDWHDLRKLRDSWPYYLIVKGILDPLDVARCSELGIDGVILSNHGGRQLDVAPSPLEILSNLACDSRMTTIVDSGFRRGSDVVKALALGAQAVSLGRAILYGLSARGEAGVRDIVRIIMDEMDRTLALIGCRSCKELDRSYVVAKM